MIKEFQLLNLSMLNIQPQVSQMSGWHSRENMTETFSKPWTNPIESSSNALLYCSSLDYAPCQLLLCFRLTVFYNLASCKFRGRNLTDLSPTKRDPYHQSITFYQPSFKFSIRSIISTFILLFQAAHPLNSCNKHLIKSPCIKCDLRQ
jgi:hypothetical protein